MDRLAEAIQKVKAGQKGQARKLLREIVEAQPDQEAAWLWLAAAEETEAEKRRCLERALQLNPENETTQQALARLGKGEIPLPQVADIVPPLEAVSSHYVAPWRSQGTRRGRIGAILFVLIFPLLLIMCLWLINPHHMERMLLSCASRGLPDCSQPAGWIMFITSMMLSIAGGLILFGVELSQPPERTQIRLISSLICLLIFFLPAYFILYFGPAILIVMEANFGSAGR
jgi:hypothetical protein